MRDILVFLEQHPNGQLQSFACELMQKASRTAEVAGMNLIAVVMGKDTEASCNQASRLGVAEMLCVESPHLDNSSGVPQGIALCKILEHLKPAYIFLSDTAIGCEMASATVVKQNAALLTGCVHVKVEETGLAFLCPTVNNRLCSVLQEESEMVVVAFTPFTCKRIGEMKRQGCATARKISAELPRGPVQLIERDLAEKEISLSEAAFIVAGGRGMGNVESFELLDGLADVLDGSGAASGATVYHGWEEESQQVGLTGTVVAPKLYIACGIAGVTQHIDGMSGAEYVLAINSNPTAPIVSDADLFVVGDVREIVQKLTDALKKLEIVE